MVTGDALHGPGMGHYLEIPPYPSASDLPQSVITLSACARVTVVICVYYSTLLAHYQVVAKVYKVLHM